jgi:predicted signal transduction protein with EAL and GGDEF domain
LDTLANVDSVTGLANRHKLYNILEMALKSQNEVTLMFLDLDNFKNVNDTLWSVNTFWYLDFFPFELNAPFFLFEFHRW